MCYGRDRNEAVAKVQALALRVIASVSTTARRRRNSSALRSRRRERLAIDEGTPSDGRRLHNVSTNGVES